MGTTAEYAADAEHAVAVFRERCEWWRRYWWAGDREGLGERVRAGEGEVAAWRLDTGTTGQRVWNSTDDDALS